MLRITVHLHKPTTSFVLEGKLVGPWVRELEKSWEDVRNFEPSSPMLVDLAAVNFIDVEGRALLSRMRQHGVLLSSQGVLIDAMVAEIEAEQGVNDGLSQAFQPAVRDCDCFPDR